jgi:4-hydroxy-4-methyl-2-oxoglutarate aldolase
VELLSGERVRLISELKQFSVCQLLDGLRNPLPFETRIRPIDMRSRICGPAFTVECVPGDNLTIHHALHVAQPGDVLVISASGNCDVGLWGELMSTSAQQRGLIGTIVDGAARDPVEIEALGYPVFCRGITPRRAQKKSYGSINVPVQVGSIRVKANDVIVADANGIVSIPYDRVPEIVELGLEVAQKENRIKEQILAGRTLFDIFELHGFVSGSEQS